MRRNLRALFILLVLAGSVTRLPASSAETGQPLETHLIPQKTLGEIRTTAARFLARHAKPNMDNILFKQTHSDGDLWTEVSGLRLTRIQVQPVDREAKAMGILGRYLVFLDCSKSHAFRHGQTGWSTWSGGPGNFLPQAVVVERMVDGQWHPSINVSLPLFEFPTQGNLNFISQQAPRLVRPRIHPPSADPLLATAGELPYAASLNIARFPDPEPGPASPAVLSTDSSGFRKSIPYLCVAAILIGAVGLIPGKSGRRSARRPVLESQASLTLARVSNVASVRTGLL
ncbi:MAG: hypothetical protein ABIS50_06245 [Luteolibacter sp.]|uniref:hypothetical protein n=1 Tax=Luteolibacter sp. TaxID=1962973 RepID=UPI00326390A9